MSKEVLGERVYTEVESTGKWRTKVVDSNGVALLVSPTGYSSKGVAKINYYRALQVMKGVEKREQRKLDSFRTWLGL